MPLLINPGGRPVEIDDKAQYEEYKNKAGFRVATAEEEQAYKEKKLKILDEMKHSFDDKEVKSDVYLATVSQGGKDGYGIASGALLRELIDQGVKISTAQRQQKVGILFHNPYSILRMENQFRILYTMFESDKLPDDWKDYLEVPDLILVPSKWCQSIFLKMGVKTEVVPLGYDQRIYRYIERKHKRNSREDFVFLHYNAFNLRKGFVETFAAFKKAFQKDEPVKMIFKTTLNQIPLPITKHEYPNIIIETGAYGDSEMVNLMGRADCFVYPSRGEGFGMTPLEAMATGMPAIVPNAHGITEYFNKDYMYEAIVKEKCPGIYSRYKGQDTGEMVVCDVDQLAAQMRYVYEHQDEAREKGALASQYVTQWTFEKTAMQLKTIIDRCLLQPTEDRPVKNVLQLEEM